MNACRGFFPTYGVKPSAREPFSGGGGNGFPPLLASHGAGVIHCIATAMCEATGKWKPGKISKHLLPWQCGMLCHEVMYSMSFALI